MRNPTTPTPVVLLLTAVPAGAAGVVTTTSAQAAPEPCRGTSALDLNGDGFDDAVVGDPFATVSGQAQAGTVVVLYGDADGRIGEGRRLVLSQATAGGAVETGDRFGWSVAVDDVTGDGCADLLVGSPGEDRQGSVDAGVTHLLSFTPDGAGGPGTPRADLIDQEDVGGSVETGDQFGWTVALSGRRSGEESLAAIGAPGEDLGAARDAGVVNTFLYSGVAFAADQVAQGRGVPGRPETGDRFGASLVIAPLEVLSGTDTGVEPAYVAGAPGDTVRRADGSVVDGAGSVTTWEWVTGFDQLVTQDSAGVVGVPETGDAFGSSIAFAAPSVSAFRRGPIAVGTPGEDVGTVPDAGSVTVLESVRGTGLVGRHDLTQASPGFAGTVERGDRFGDAVAMSLRADLGARLAIGSPSEDVGAVRDAGMVQTAVLTQDPDAVVPGPSYTENAAGTPGTVAAGNRFGRALSQDVGLAETVLLVASPYQRSGAVFVVDDRGGTRAWVPGRGGIPASSGRFGWSLAGLSSQ